MTRDRIIHYLEQMKNGTRIIEYRNAVSAAVSIIRDLPQWIPVTARLPDDDRCVLIVASGKPCENVTLENAQEIAFFCADEGVWFIEAWPDWQTATVTHWMPLPEPPKEDVK